MKIRLIKIDSFGKLKFTLEKLLQRLQQTEVNWKANQQRLKYIDVSDMHMSLKSTLNFASQSSLKSLFTPKSKEVKKKAIYNLANKGNLSYFWLWGKNNGRLREKQ